MKLSWPMELAQWLVIAAMFAVAAAAWSHVPERMPIHWNMHGEVDGYGGRFAGLLLVWTLGWLEAAYPVAFALALVQLAVGLLLFHAVNLRPRHPGALVAFHQSMVLAITCAIVFSWRW